MGSDGVFAEQPDPWHKTKACDLPSIVLWQRDQPNCALPRIESHNAIWFRKTDAVRVAGFKLFVQNLPPYCTKADVHSLLEQAGLPCTDVGVFLAINSQS